jgi:dihydrofolate reductase
MPVRKIIVNAGTSADGFIARPDGDIDWLTSRPKPAGFYDMVKFTASVDAKILGRNTYEKSLELGATFGGKDKTYVFSSSAPAAPPPNGVEFVSEPIAAFAQRVRRSAGKNIWMMGGGGIIASFLDAGAIDEFIITVMPVMIGDGIPLIARRHRHVELKLLSSRQFDDGVVQLRYEVAAMAPAFPQSDE